MRLTVESLQRLWLMKLNGIRFVDEWLSETKDAEVRAGLSGQLEDERRHVRLLGDQVKRLGPGSSPNAYRETMARPFAEARAQSSDLHRLVVYHRGIKAFIVDRCSHLIPAVDARLAQALDLVAREDQRHIRWADLRVARLMTPEKTRECSLLTTKTLALVESTWERPWRQQALGS